MKADAVFAEVWLLNISAQVYTLADIDLYSLYIS